MMGVNGYQLLTINGSGFASRDFGIYDLQRRLCLVVADCLSKRDANSGIRQHRRDCAVVEHRGVPPNTINSNAVQLNVTAGASLTITSVSNLSATTVQTLIISANGFM